MRRGDGNELRRRGLGMEEGEYKWVRRNFRFGFVRVDDVGCRLPLNLDLNGLEAVGNPRSEDGRRKVGASFVFGSFEEKVN